MNACIGTKRNAVATMGLLGGVLAAVGFAVCCGFLLLLGIVHAFAHAPRVAAALSAFGVPTQDLASLPGSSGLAVCAVAVVALLAWRFVWLTLPAYTVHAASAEVLDWKSRLKRPALAPAALLLHGIAALVSMALCELVALFATMFLGRALTDVSIAFHWVLLLGPVVLVCCCCLFLYTLHTFRLYFGRPRPAGRDA